MKLDLTQNYPILFVICVYLFTVIILGITDGLLLLGIPGTFVNISKDTKDTLLVNLAILPLITAFFFFCFATPFTNNYLPGKCWYAFCFFLMVGCIVKGNMG
jgi:hypothetical protein